MSLQAGVKIEQPLSILIKSKDEHDEVIAKLKVSGNLASWNMSRLNTYINFVNIDCDGKITFSPHRVGGYSTIFYNDFINMKFLPLISPLQCLANLSKFLLDNKKIRYTDDKGNVMNVTGYRLDNEDGKMFLHVYGINKERKTVFNYGEPKLILSGISIEETIVIKKSLADYVN